MITTHTPGPWKVSKHASGLLKIETKDRVICDGFAGESANAALIASAPDLLAALVSAEGLVYEAQSDIPEEYRAKRDCLAALSIIRAAIAKATNPNA